MFRKIIAASFIITLVVIDFFPKKTEAFRLLPKVSAPEAMNEIFSDLGVDKSELRYAVKSLNVSRRKKYPPTVALNFQPSNPVPGEKITVVATPQFFMNENQNLYFTWYLKSKYCSDKNDSDYNYNSKCDLDKNGRVDFEDYKIRAMRIIANNDFEWEKADYSNSVSGDQDGYQAIFGGDDQKGKNNHCFVHDTRSGDEYEIECQHLFPNAPHETTGDGTFGKDEEKFWRTDPMDQDTADTGNGDEANVVGKGQYTFSWNYEAGDKVGVVIEGISVEATQEKDSSYKIMWALPNGCDVDSTENGEEASTGKNTEITEEWDDQIGAYVRTTITTTQETMPNGKISVTEITLIEYLDSNKNLIGTDGPTESNYYLNPWTASLGSTPGVNQESSVSLDINECLPDNLVDPMDGGGRMEKMEVNLSYLPQFPVNDPSGDSADELIVHSSVINAKNPGFLKYTWQVYASNEMNPDSWGDPIPKEYLTDAKQTAGIGLDTLRFKLNFGIDPTDSLYLKVKLNVLENVSDGIAREGHSSIIIPISLSNQKIRVYNVAASTDQENPILSLKENPANERCIMINDQNIEKSTPICPVAKNEIIGMKLNQGNLKNYEFLWTVNGEPMKPFYYSGNEQCLSGECDPDTGDATNIAFFPILENKGKRYNIALTVTDLENQGKKTTLTKTFEVVDPEARVLPVDQNICQPKFLGNYVDLNGTEWPDYSKDNFLALTGSPLQFKPGFIAFSPEKFEWYVDGELVTTDNARSLGYNIDDKGIITVPGKPADAYYKIGLNALYNQDINIRRALNKYWDVSYSEFYEKPVGNEINVKITGSLAETQGASLNSKRILANIWSGTPAYLLFLLRIVLTIGIMIFISSLVFSLFPEIKNQEE